MNSSSSYFFNSTNELSLYLNIIGGHSLFLLLNNEKLIKQTNDKEINFYQYSTKNKYNYVPKFYGYINSGSYEYTLICDYVEQIKVFFKYFINKIQINIEEFNIDKSDRLSLSLDNLNSYSSSKYSNKDKLNSSFIQLEETLLSFDRSKLIWIIFWFVNSFESFLTGNFIIIENEGLKTNNPFIMDIKFGTSARYSKKDKIMKKFHGSQTEIGCRIMGSQRNGKMIHRHQTKFTSVPEFINEIKKFYSHNGEHPEIYYQILNKSISEINKIIDTVDSLFSEFSFKFFSLLIIYQTEGNIFSIKHSIIDFSYFEQDSSKEEKEKNKDDILFSIQNFLRILNELAESK